MEKIKCFICEKKYSPKNIIEVKKGIFACQQCYILGHRNMGIIKKKKKGHKGSKN